jgi:RNA polymerase sigma-70 factor (ECF subfamily)
MALRHLPSSLPGKGERFQTTAWTAILSARDPGAEDYRANVEYLVETYWRPAYLFVRSKGKNHEAAKDLTQEFFALFLEKNFLKSVDREKGRFRTFLLTALSRFLMNAYARDQALKRGGGLKPLQSLEALKDEEAGRGYEPAEGETAEEVFNRNFARALLARVFERLKAACERDRKPVYYELLRAQFFDTGPGGSRPSYQDLASKFRLTETDITNFLHRAKRLYRDLLRSEIRSYVSSDEEVEEELRDLWRSLAL